MKGNIHVQVRLEKLTQSFNKNYKFTKNFLVIVIGTELSTINIILCRKMQQNFPRKNVKKFTIV